MKTEPQTAQPRHIGTGWISGTLAVVLALVGLLAVFCFHFPEYLTLPELRDKYPIPVMRGVLHVVLVAAFLLGFASVMLRHNKTLGLAAMLIVLVAALLGGSRVPIDGAGKLPEVYFGLDYVLLILIIYSLIFIPLEKLFENGPGHAEVALKNGATAETGPLLRFEIDSPHGRSVANPNG